MFFEIIQPTESLRPYITRYVFVRAEGSTDTMAPPADDPRFVNGKHVQPLLPNYGSFVFMRNVLTDIEGVPSDGLTLSHFRKKQYFCNRFKCNLFLNRVSIKKMEKI